jgi:hypothetical protein
VEQEALRFPHAMLPQCCELRLCLDALGADTDPKPIADHQYRPDYDARRRLSVDRSNEGLIDLNFLDSEVAYIA